MRIKEYSDDEKIFSKKLQNRINQKKTPIYFDDNWNLVKGRDYYIQAFLYDKNGNEILIEEDVVI